MKISYGRKALPNILIVLLVPINTASRQIRRSPEIENRQNLVKTVPFLIQCCIAVVKVIFISGESDLYSSITSLFEPNWVKRCDLIVKLAWNFSWKEWTWYLSQVASALYHNAALLVPKRQPKPLQMDIKTRSLSWTSCTDKRSVTSPAIMTEASA